MKKQIPSGKSQLREGDTQRPPRFLVRDKLRSAKRKYTDLKIGHYKRKVRPLRKAATTGRIKMPDLPAAGRFAAKAAAAPEKRGTVQRYKRGR